MAFTLTDMNIRMAEYQQYWKINETLARPWPSLFPSKLSMNISGNSTHASQEQPVTMSVIPIIEGDVDDSESAGWGYSLELRMILRDFASLRLIKLK
ncbi:hypothetical protein I7I53_00354 [Histoplasma capsulatum var. duboisii H88]|uniref:Uncharacterized protein n=1 Tax=Ajellomyces capsulatus (strain H88) TaxID=544711 RepID=A0A8A1LGJ9_AJEC8|nr:hypothetical protein I7I53_00354 [Histoplasma capsulatum var. duboisii H88]